MKITALTENTSSSENIRCEHGLSLYIQTDKYNILFDMGQTDLFEENAKKLDLDLSEIDTAVLSHGHYDHSGGLARFLEINQKASVYLNQYAFEPHYNGTKYIGMDISLKDNDRLIFTDDVFQIADGLTLYSCNDRKKPYELGSFGLSMVQNGEFLPDDFRHEHYLLIEENGRRILISGCSHKGIMNIAEWFKPDVLIGGFHFSKLPLDDALKSYAERLDEYDTSFYTCHCTGVSQYEFMKTYMKDLHYISAGSTIDI